jgi:hypothetical protein
MIDYVRTELRMGCCSILEEQRGGEVILSLERM